MKLFFVDGSSIDIITVLATRSFIGGMSREMFTIEVEDEKYTLEELKEIFSNVENLKRLRTVEDNGDQYDIGEDYTILVSVSYELKDMIPPAENVLEKPKTIYGPIVKLAKVGYVEKMIEKLIESDENNKTGSVRE